MRFVSRLRPYEKDVLLLLLKGTENCSIVSLKDRNQIVELTNKLTNYRLMANIGSYLLALSLPLPLTGAQWLMCCGALGYSTHKISKFFIFETQYQTLYSYALKYELDKKIDKLEINDKKKVTLAQSLNYLKTKNHNFLAPGTQQINL